MMEETELIQKVKRGRFVRRRLLLKDRDCVYHVISRTACRQYILGDKEKEMFRRMMYKMAKFCGMEIITYCVMSNHFHILVRVPYEPEISDEVLLERYKVLYDGEYCPLSSLTYTEMVKVFKAGGANAEDAREMLTARMGDLSVFMRELKQRFCIWYNDKHKNIGTIWAERFRSLVVEDCSHALSTVAAYIDLNPLRARLVEDPGDYRFCGYAQAVGGSEEARKGLMSIWRNGESWRKLVAIYRLILFDRGYHPKKEKDLSLANKNKGSISWETLQKIVKEKGKLSLQKGLRYRVRYFTAGLALGGEDFLQEIYKDYSDHFTKDRKRTVHEMKGAEWGSLRCVRDLQVDVMAITELT